MNRYIGALAFTAAAIIAAAGCSREVRLTTSSDEALRLYEQGVDEMKKFQYREAEAAFQKAITADSGFAMAWGRLATVAERTMRDSLARALMARALREAEGATERERLYLSLWYQRQRYEYKGVAAAADSLIALYPDEREAMFERGLMHEIGKKPDEAIRIYERASEGEKPYPLAVMQLAYLYSEMGLQDKALPMMRRYIELVPDAADPRASYADLLARVGKYDEALEQYAAALEINPDYWYAYREVGRIYMILGRLRESEKHFQRSLALLPPSVANEASRLVTQAGMAIRRGEYAEAQRLSLKALAVDTTLGGAAFNLAYAFAKQGKIQEADTVLARVYSEFQRRNLSGTRSMTEYYALQAQVSLEAGNLAAAEAACVHAQEFASRLSQGNISRILADVRLKQGRFDEALDACEEALLVNPNQPDALLLLVRIYHAMGDQEMVTEIGGRLLTLWNDADPDFKDLKELRRLLPRSRRAV